MYGTFYMQVVRQRRFTASTGRPSGHNPIFLRYILSLLYYKVVYIYIITGKRIDDQTCVCDSIDF